MIRGAHERQCLTGARVSGWVCVSPRLTSWLQINFASSDRLARYEPQSQVNNFRCGLHPERRRAVGYRAGITTPPSLIRVGLRDRVTKGKRIKVVGAI